MVTIENLTSPSLARSLLTTAQILARVLQEGQSLTDALLVSKHLPINHRAAVQDLAFHTLRNLALGQALLKALVNRPLSPDVQHLLTVALALLAADADQGGGQRGLKYPPHTLTDEAVTAAAECTNGARVGGLVNGVLRTFLREREARITAAMTNPVVRWNAPLWWIEALQTAWPNDWQAILTAGRQAPPLTLRANLRCQSRAALQASLAKAGHSSRSLGDQQALLLDKPKPVSQLPGFSAGGFSVQDEGAQRAAHYLDVQPGMRVLDACAAPGGKTAHLLELVDCAVTAIDCDPARLDRVTDNLTRLQLSAKVLHADALRPADWWDGQLFDRILLDAPCTASGIVRRHPDIVWLRQADDAPRLARTQAGLLKALWPLLKPGGKLVYVTCSVWPAEGADQIAAFLQRNPNAKPLIAPLQLLPIANEQDNHDGFFYAVLSKS